MQLSKFSQNKSNLLNRITRLIKKLNIPTPHIDLQNISKSKWKSTAVKHMGKYANSHCETKRKNLSKLKYLFKHKQEMITICTNYQDQKHQQSLNCPQE